VKLFRKNSQVLKGRHVVLVFAAYAALMFSSLALLAAEILTSMATKRIKAKLDKTTKPEVHGKTFTHF